MTAYCSQWWHEGNTRREICEKSGESTEKAICNKGYNLLHYFTTNTYKTKSFWINLWDTRSCLFINCSHLIKALSSHGIVMLIQFQPIRQHPLHHNVLIIFLNYLEICYPNISNIICFSNAYSCNVIVFSSKKCALL